MKDLWRKSDRSAILARIATLTPESRARWGKFTVDAMLCHLADTVRMAHGDLPVKAHRGRVFTVFPLKHLFLYVVPIPKGVPTAPELLATAPTTFEADRTRCHELIERYAQTPPAGPGARHPLFGVLSWREWGVLQWRHTDHHLRQFGA
jgi:hypothetical protein